MTWSLRVLALAGLVVVAWACATSLGAIVHGHPAYAVLLVLTVAASAVVGWRSRRPLPRPTGWRAVLRVTALVAAAAWIAAIAWLRPYPAVEPSLTAMGSDAAVMVTSSATRITMAPSGDGSGAGVVFQPGALVDARAYAAVLRPLAESGHTVVIVKQPLGIAFLAVGAFDAARGAHPQIEHWVVGGHSLGGVVASSTADAADDDVTAPAVGLLLYAAYPANDMSDTLNASVLSISGSRDDLSTPAEIDASRADLPADATFVVVEGASHADFGDYGPQRGDGESTIDHGEARAQISDVSVRFVNDLGG